MALIFLVFWQKENITVIHRGVSREDAFKLSEPVPLDVFKPKKHRLANGLYGGWTACLIFVISLLFYYQKNPVFFIFFTCTEMSCKKYCLQFYIIRVSQLSLRHFCPHILVYPLVLSLTTTPVLISLG